MLQTDIRRHAAFPEPLALVFGRNSCDLGPATSNRQRFTICDLEHLEPQSFWQKMGQTCLVKFCAIVQFQASLPGEGGSAKAHPRHQRILKFLQRLPRMVPWEICTAAILQSLAQMTVELIEGSSAPYLPRSPCIPSV